MCSCVAKPHLYVLASGDDRSQLVDTYTTHSHQLGGRTLDLCMRLRMVKGKEPSSS